MNAAQKIVMIVGSGFAGLGLLFMLMFGAMEASRGGEELVVAVCIPGVFLLVGVGMMAGVWIGMRGKRQIRKKGTKYAAKIYGYVKNTAYTVNGVFTVNTKVHYFDNRGIEREAILPTGFATGSDEYPIGMTIDIYEYNGKYAFDPQSVRNEVLPRENELMDNKPIEPDKLQLQAVQCPSCGASFQAAAGYSNKCPYCGNYWNV